MGLPAWTDDAQSNPQMMMKYPSFKLRPGPGISRARGITRAMPPVSTLTLRHEQVNCSAGALPIQWGDAGSSTGVESV